MKKSIMAKDLVGDKFIKKNHLFVKLSIFLYTAQVIYFLILHYLGRHFPETSFLFYSSDRFNDWNNSVLSAAKLNPYFDPSPALATYFPFSYLFFYVGSLFNKSNSILFYVSTTITIFVIGFQKLYKSLLNISNITSSFKNNNFFILLLILLFQYPALMSLDRGNIDLFLSGITAIALSFYFNKRYILFGTFIAIAAAFKGFPLFFTILLLRERKFYTILYTVGLFIILNITALTLYKGGIFVNFLSFLNFLSQYKEVYLIGNGSLHFFSDFYNFGKLVMAGLSLERFYAQYYIFYSIFIGIFLLLGSYFILFRIRDNIDACGLCILISVIYPCAINDYKLTILYNLLLILLVGRNTSLKLILILACLFSPKNYFVLSGVINSNTLINPFLLFLIVFFYFKDLNVRYVNA